MSNEGVLITQSNIHLFTPEDILSFGNNNYWHKFILENGGLFEKDAVLEEVLKSVSPHSIIPVKYTVMGKNAYFLARNCGEAIQQLCLNLLPTIQMKNPPGQVKISIQHCSISLKHSKMNLLNSLIKALKKCFTKKQIGSVDLSSFHKDPELYKTICYPLSEPEFLEYVLNTLNKSYSKSDICAIKLSNNDIEIIKGLEALQCFDKLISLDLSDNKIKDQDLPNLLQKAAPNLKELKLSGNPICSAFQTEAEYLKWVLDKNPCIKVLDGVVINYNIPNHQVYMCSGNVNGIINEFLKHYFTLYDENRRALKNSYDTNAVFSLICNHSPSQKFADALLGCYEFKSRNLLEEKNIMGILYQNNEEIGNVLRSLPLTKHDPYSFKIDVFFYENLFLAFMVSGLFRDFQKAPRLRSFNRTFVLKRVSDDEFKITNDLYHVTEATADEINSSFLHNKPHCKLEEPLPLVTMNEEHNLIQIFSNTTEMNSVVSRRCLEECNWDLKRAFEFFLEKYKRHITP